MKLHFYVRLLRRDELLKQTSSAVRLCVLALPIVRVNTIANRRLAGFW